MQPKQCIAIIDSIKSYAKQNPTEAQVYEDWFQAVVNLRDALPQDKRFDAYKYSGELRSVCAAMMGKMKTGEDVAKVYDIIGRTYLFEAKDVFDSYCIYLEWNRAPEKKFYQPRRRILHTLVNDLEDLFFHRVDFLGISMAPRTGKSTLCIFFITWLMGNRPDVASVMSGHSDKLTNGFYGEVLSIITDPVTYNWGKIFPDVQLVDKSAKDESVDLNRKKRFPTLTCRSIGGTLTGAVEIGEGGVLYSDDLIEDLEESLNVERLNNKYDAYLNQLKDRKKQGALELMVGTRWNVLDPLGRIQNQYADNPKYRFRVIPAVNENGHSNFNYDYGVGFDDAYYADMSAVNNFYPPSVEPEWVVENDLIDIANASAYYDGDSKILFSGTATVIEPTETVWGVDDYLTTDDCTRWLSNISSIRSKCSGKSSTPETPGSFSYRFSIVNQLEKVLFDIEAMAKDHSIYCSELICGGEPYYAVY